MSARLGEMRGCYPLVLTAVGAPDLEHDVDHVTQLLAVDTASAVAIEDLEAD